MIFVGFAGASLRSTGVARPWRLRGLGDTNVGMRRFLLVGLLVVGCTKGNAVREIAVAEAATQINAGTSTPVDANTPEYRDGAGWVPGAVLLSDFADYPLSELPADKGRPLIFYCTSRM